MPDVVITDSEYGDSEVERTVLEAAGLTVARAKCETEADVVRAASDARGLIVQYAPISAEVLKQLPALRVVSRYGTGYDNVDVAAATRSGVWVSNIPVYGGDEVAVHTLTLLLGCVRGLSQYAAVQRSGGWPPAAVLAPDLDRLSVGVLGAGRIGRRVIELVSPLVGAVRWFDPYLTDPIPGAERADSLDELLRATHVLTVHLPLEAETLHLIGAPQIAALREPRILLNAARGPIVERVALEAAIVDGTLWAAGLDVVEGEPLPPGDPILASPRVLATPHSAWASASAQDDVRRRAARNVVAALVDGSPETAVNQVSAR